MNRHNDPIEPTPEGAQPADHVEGTSSPVGLIAPESDYAEFGLWIDAELAKLVAHWGPTAAPRAQQASNRAKFGR